MTALYITGGLIAAAGLLCAGVLWGRHNPKKAKAMQDATNKIVLNVKTATGEALDKVTSK